MLISVQGSREELLRLICHWMSRRKNVMPKLESNRWFYLETFRVETPAVLSLLRNMGLVDEGQVYHLKSQASFPTPLALKWQYTNCVDENDKQLYLRVSLYDEFVIRSKLSSTGQHWHWATKPGSQIAGTYLVKLTPAVSAQRHSGSLYVMLFAACEMHLYV